MHFRDESMALVSNRHPFYYFKNNEISNNDEKREQTYSAVLRFPLIEISRVRMRTVRRNLFPIQMC